MKTYSKNFIKETFPELLRYKIRSSRMYESNEKAWYRDNWWFNFMESDLTTDEYIVFAGALDYINRDFRIFKVPSSVILSNLEKINIDSKGWINLYIDMNTLIDSRHQPGQFSFEGYELN
jgi:hypothetical protein